MSNTRRPPQRGGSTSDHRQPLRAFGQTHCGRGDGRHSRRRPDYHRQPYLFAGGSNGNTGQPVRFLAQNVREKQHVPLNIYRGLHFGLLFQPQFPPDVYLEGAAIRQSMLSREHQGPRAVLNSIERLAGSYGSECDRLRQDLAIAKSQLRDWQDRLGSAFAHEDYLSDLTNLRNQLKEGLSGSIPDSGAELRPAASELARQIKVLKAKHSIDATPERVGKHRTAAEEPVTMRIRRHR